MMSTLKKNIMAEIKVSLLEYLCLKTFTLTYL